MLWCGAGMTPLCLAARRSLSAGRDVAPGQVLDLGVQGGLVALHDQDVMRLLVADQELRVLALGV